MKTKAVATPNLNPTEEFINAAAKGRLAMVKKWIAKDKPLNLPAFGGKTALMAAAENGHLDIVKMLIEAGAELDTAAKGRWTAMSLAIARGHEQVVKTLFTAGANPNVQNREEETPLSLALKSGQKQLAHWLQSRWARRITSDSLNNHASDRARYFGMSRQTEDMFGKSPSAKQKKAAAKMASYLLKKVGRLVRSGAQGGDYAVWEAAKYGDSVLAAKLLKAKANPNFAPHIGSALSMACERGHLDTARMLLDSGANVDYGGTGNAPILEAAKGGYTRVVVELINRGARINVRRRYGPTPLLVATAGNDLRLMEVLLAAKANPDQVGTVEIGPRPDPTTKVEPVIEGSPIAMRTTNYPDAPEADNAPPLVVAVRCNFIDALKLLIRHGANLEATDNEGKTALAWARKLGAKEIESALVASGARTSIDLEGSPLNALIIAAKNGNLDRVEELLAKDADADAHLDSEEGRMTPLAAAAEAGHLEIVRALLSAGADPNKPVAELLGTRNLAPLMLAARETHVPIVKMLLDAKADIHATTFEPFGGGGDTALHYAARGGSPEVIKLLLRAGASLSARNKSRYTALQIACGHGHADAIELLLPSGNRLLVVPGKVLPLLHDAAFSNNLATVKRLLAINPGCHATDVDFACMACHGINLDIVTALVNSGMPINGKDSDGVTPLINAVRAMRVEVVRFLLSRGANPDVRISGGKTALSIARNIKCKPIIELLRQNQNKK